MMHSHGGSRTPPRISLNSNYSYGYSPTSDDPRNFLPAAQQDTAMSPNHNNYGPVSPPLTVLTEEYAQAFRTSNAKVSDEEPRTTFDAENADPMDMHLLLETAMNDSQLFKILSLDDLDALKKEESRLARLIEAGKRKLYLESRVDSTSRLIQKLSSSGSNATSPTSPLSSKRSFLRFRGSGSSNVDAQSTYGDAGSGSPRFQELAKEVWRLEKRQTELHRKKLEHTAGILQYNSQRQGHTGEPSNHQMPDGAYNHGYDEGYERHALSSPRELDGASEGLEWQSSARVRFPIINSDLHHLLKDIETQDRANAPSPPGIDLGPSTQFDYLESSLQKLSDSHNQLQRLVQESRRTREIQEQEVRDSRAELRRLWDMIGAREDGIHDGNRQVERAENGVQLNTSDSGYGQSFSPQALASKVQKLCSRATLLSKHQSALTQQLSQEREARRNSSSVRATERTQAAKQLQELYNQHLVGQSALKEVQSRLKATELRLKETQHQVQTTKEECQIIFADELAQERKSWKSREHELSALLASKVTEAGLLMNAISAHEATIAELQAAEAATTLEFNEADHQIETLGANLMAAENRLAKYENTEMDTSKVINQLKADRDRQEAELALLRGEVAKITADLMAAEGHLTRYEGEAEESTERIKTLNAAKIAADIELLKLNAEIATLASRLQEIEQRATTGNSAAQDTRLRFSELTAAKEHLELEMDSLHSEVEHLRDVLKRTEERALNHEKSAREWSDHASKLEANRQALEDEIDRSREGLSEGRSKSNAALAAKVQELETLTSKHMDLLQDFKELNNTHANSVKTLENKSQELEMLTFKHAQLSNETRALRHSTGSEAGERHRLQFELDATMANGKAAQDRVAQAEQELKDLLHDYEQLVKMEVEAEREREMLEQTLEGLRDRVEELQVLLDDERVRSMGNRNSGSTNGEHANGVNGDMHGGNVGQSTEGISMGVMRNEFKRMMREARADHHRRLKAEQEEHRRLEEIIRSMQKDRSRSRASTSAYTLQDDFDHK